MARFRHPVTGVVVNVSDEKGRVSGFAPVEAATADDQGGGYDGRKVADLRAEVASRNEGRVDGDLIPVDGNKGDLVAALTTDDNK